MTFFLTRQNFLAITIALSALACGDKPPGGGTASESTGAPDSSSSGGTDPTTTGEPSSTATGDMSGPSTAGETSGATSSSTSATSVATTTGTTTGDDTTGGELCEIQPAACGFAEQLGNDVVDCGVVDPWNHDVAAWQAAHDCALKAVAEERAFCLVTVLQGIDSEVAEAFAAQEARSYAIEAFFFDSDPCGGGGCGPALSQASCATLTAIDGCTVEPGNACLNCATQGQSTKLCGP